MRVAIIGTLGLTSILLVLRASVFRLERALERRRQDRGKPPLLALPPLGLNLDVFDPERYTPEGRRYIPWIAAAQLCLLAALAWFVLLDPAT